MCLNNTELEEILKNKELKERCIKNRICPCCGESIVYKKEKQEPIIKYKREFYLIFFYKTIPYSYTSFNYFFVCSKDETHYKEHYFDDYDDY